MSDEGRTFIVYLSGDFALSVDEIWPDGGAPENPTDEDVRKVMESYGPKSRTLSDWGIEPDVSVGLIDVWANRR